MKLSDFDYNLPEELIAQYPAEFRDESKLLIMEKDGSLIDSQFYNITDYLNEGDLLVMNNSRVIRAQLSLVKNDKEVSVNLNREIEKNKWSAFAKPAKKLNEGDIFQFGEYNLKITEKREDGEIVIEFILNDKISVFDFLEIFGSIPLPPYIRDGIADFDDDDRYQTIFSKYEGSVAAPTAGLHFSDEVFVNMQKKNIDYCFVTLHVGAGTFLPVKTENIDEHKMHSEYAIIDENTANLINKAKEDGRRIIAVGTTSMRTLESFAKSNLENNGKLKSGSIETQLFIKPGFDFKICDGLITNFHLPKSTLLMLISAFSGYENVKKAYQHAIENKYRFFSYGDAMFIQNINN